MTEHKPGEAHEYLLICKVCDQPGIIRLTIDPQHDMEAHLEYEWPAARLAEAEAAVATGLFIPDVTKHEPRNNVGVLRCSCGHVPGPNESYFDHLTRADQ